MKQSYRLILSGVTGQYQGNVPLQLFYGPYLASFLIVAQIVAYNAYMSLKFYEDLLGRIMGNHDKGLALFTTTSLAVMLYCGISALAGAYLDRRKKTPGILRQDRVLFHSLLLIVICFLGLDIYANWKGRGEVAQETTEAPPESKQDSVYLALQYQIDAKQAQLDSLKKGYFKGFGWFEQGAYQFNWSGKELDRNLRSEIQGLREQQTLFTSHELDAEAEAIQEFKAETASKAQAHGFLVILAYPVAFLLSLFRKYYSLKATAFLAEKARQAQEPPAPAPSPEGYPITCAHCGKTAHMKSPRAQYCSTTCRSAAHKRKKKLQSV